MLQRKFRLSTCLLLLAIASSAPNRASAQQTEDRQYYALVPATGQTVALAENELREGEIYSHYSTRLNRRVWSFYLGNGRFWDAFGPGSTQPARRFDRTVAERQPINPGDESGKGTKPDFNARNDRPVFFRLDADNTWRIAQNTSLPKVFSQETGYRFEQHFRDRYTPVSHTFGYRWQYVNGDYEPAESVAFY